MGSFFLYVLIAVIAVLAGVVVAVNHRHVGVLWGSLAILLAAAAMCLCVYAKDVGTFRVRADGNPSDAVSAFFDAVIAEDYNAAYAHLENCGSLGLENTPASDNGVALWNALRESYGYTLIGSAKIDGLTALQDVDFTYLDLSAVDAKVQETTQTELEKIVQSKDRSEIYDENNQYLPEITNQAYANALTSALENADQYKTTVQLSIALDYSDHTWYLATDQTLLKALLGGVA